MGDPTERKPDQPATDEAADGALGLDTEGHSFYNPTIYSDLAREHQRDLARDTERTRSKKVERSDKKRRWPFG